MQVKSNNQNEDSAFKESFHYSEAPDFGFTYSLKETANAIVSRKASERTIIRNLDIIILCLAKKQSINGYDINLFIRHYFNVWLSSGTIYSALHMLEKKKLLHSEKKRKAKNYMISKKGKETLEIMYFNLNKIKYFYKYSE